MKMTGADLLIRLLERQGIRTIAGLPGGANIITAIADAKLDSIPIICITGQVPLPLIGTDAFQEVDVFGLSLPITKHSYLVKSAEELLRIIPEAFRIATSGRPGPVWIDIPKDVQNATIEFDNWPLPGEPNSPCTPQEADIAQAITMIEAAHKPILYLGGGIIHSDCADSAKALIDRSDLPTVSTLMALGAIPHDHPRHLGMLGMHAAPYTNMALEECDLLIAVGARFDDRATGKVTEFCPRAKVIHIDIDKAELGKIRQPTLAIRADAGRTLERLLAALPQRKRADWNARIDALKAIHPMQMPGLGDPSTPYGLLESVARHAGSDAIITTDVGQHQMWTAQAFPFCRPRQWLTSGGLGTMGFGFPAAIGAALAQPERTVVCISGDGSFLMNNQELLTAAELGLNIKIVLMNNQSLGLVHQQQTLFFGKRLIASRFEQNADFALMAQAMGVAAIDLANEPDTEAALARAFAHTGPMLINAPICAQQQVLPMVPPGGANREMLVRAAS